MCGIVAAASHRDVVPMLLEGLRRLEYRGYDSCGVATLDQGVLKRARTVSRVHELVERVAEDGVKGTVGIAHTRWATHGAPEVCNAHPHISRNRIALVHNGIIENHEEIRRELQAKGYEFTSQTDTEVVAHLINDNDDGDLLKAVMTAVTRLRGSYAIAVIAADEPDRVIAARQGSPMVVGVGDGENFIASDAMAVGGTTDRIVYVHEGDVVDVRPDSWQVYERTEAGEFIPADREVKVVHAYAGAVELGPYRHFMQKEIFEQPRAVGDTLEGVAAFSPTLFGAEAEGIFRNTQRLLFLACGTSYYSALTAKYWIEEIAGIPCDVEIASEYRYRVSVPDPRTLVVTISQSGETADTLAALRHARDELGMSQTLTICNVATSAMVNESRLAYITRAGVEIGVASTKAFTTQLTALYLLACTLAKLNGRLTKEDEETELKRLRHLPAAMSAVLALEPQIIAWAERFAAKQHALFLGRGVHYPIALEGALKLKEISYIHSEAYAAGELKHGTISLIEPGTLVIGVLTQQDLYEKTVSNMVECKSRGAYLMALTTYGNYSIEDCAEFVIYIPKTDPLFAASLAVIPLQLMGYYVSVAKGLDVDKPRNLAKSVTVE